MGYITLGLLLCCTLVAVISISLKTTLEYALEFDHIVPDIIPVSPLEMIKVNYPSRVISQYGKELTPTQVKTQPIVRWKDDPKKYYTLCLFDPDFPSLHYHVLAQFVHWLVVNIPGKNVNLGESLVDYVGAAPPKVSGRHRYIFLVYEQPSKLKFDEPYINNSTVEKRCRFSIVDFANKYNLGDPQGGNYFWAQYDEHVSSLDQQFGS